MHHVRKLSFVAALVLALASITARAEDQKKHDLKDLEPTVDAALKAYNEQDWKAFYKDYAKMMAGIATEQAFGTMYKGMYWPKYGKYESKKLIDKESVLLGDMPLLVYEAKFEKAEKVKVSINFTTEEGKLKLMQVQFNEIK